MRPRTPRKGALRGGTADGEVVVDGITNATFALIEVVGTHVSALDELYTDVCERLLPALVGIATGCQSDGARFLALTAINTLLAHYSDTVWSEGELSDVPEAQACEAALNRTMARVLVPALGAVLSSSERLSHAGAPPCSLFTWIVSAATAVTPHHH
jgi:hypothetical protein